MFDSTVDIVKTAALALAILVPSIAAWFVYRREERRSKAPASIGGPAMAAIAGALVSEATAERAMQTAHEVKDSVNRLARAIEQYNEESQVRSRMMDRFCDEVVAVRRAIEEMASTKRRR